MASITIMVVIIMAAIKPIMLTMILKKVSIRIKTIITRIKKLNIKKIMAVTTIMVATIITIIAISKSTAFNNS